MTQEIITYFKSLQLEICSALEIADGKSKFILDEWNRAEGGGGLTRVIKEGNVIEKGGVNFSCVEGNLPAFLQKESKTGNASSFLASGVSIVIHPQNPWVPIIHMNVRYFEMNDGTWWFGGGIDLTSHYVNEEQAIWFHIQLKMACDKHHADFYPKFKKWADEYFFIKHRNETRGIGGVFFDHLNDSSSSLDKLGLFNFIKDVGNTFAPTYIELIKRNKSLPYTDQNKNWQLLRRGRYVEFNLVYDRGTKFGLETNGRVESILMSLPKMASWEYDFVPPNGSPEHQTLLFLNAKP